MSAYRSTAGPCARSVTAEPVQPASILTRSVVPALTVGIVNGHGNQRDRGDGTHLGFAELAEPPDPLHHAFDGGVDLVNLDGVPVDGHDDGEDRCGRLGGCTAPETVPGEGVCPFAFLLCSCLGLRVSRPPLFLPPIVAPARIRRRGALVGRRTRSDCAAPEFVEILADAVEQAAGNNARGGFVRVRSHGDQPISTRQRMGGDSKVEPCPHATRSSMASTSLELTACVFRDVVSVAARSTPLQAVAHRLRPCAASSRTRTASGETLSGGSGPARYRELLSRARHTRRRAIQLAARRQRRRAERCDGRRRTSSRRRAAAPARHRGRLGCLE